MRPFRMPRPGSLPVTPVSNEGIVEDPLNRNERHKTVDHMPISMGSGGVGCGGGFVGLV